MPELDTLRGIAVSLVVLFHSFGFLYGVSGLSGIPKLLVALTLPGWVGVNLFFVLSGFLITGILLDTKARSDYYKHFYIHRALRILPLYYVVLILLAVVVRLHLVPRHASWAFLGLSAIYLANVTNLLGVPMQYGVLWSLAVEEHFYLVWPAVVKFFSRRAIVFSAVTVAMACLLLRIIYYVLGASGGGYTWLSADGLALGAILAVVARMPDAHSAVRKFAMTSLLVSLGVFLAGVPYGIFFARHFLGVTLRETAIDLFFAAVVAGALLLGISRWKGLVNFRGFQFLGKISYGVYLMHMLVFEIVVGLMRRRWPDLPPASGHFGVMVLQFGIAGGCTVVLTYLSRMYFEEWFLRLKDRKKVPRTAFDERKVVELDPAPQGAA